MQQPTDLWPSLSQAVLEQLSPSIDNTWLCGIPSGSDLFACPSRRGNVALISTGARAICCNKLNLFMVKVVFLLPISKASSSSSLHCLNRFHKTTLKLISAIGTRLETNLGH
eukprot:TRINITY_DN3488_c1_g1_i1.p1 TRINITY_DN3488_c1_g1~~TRINITY_DN3488_c1_g1_i1.p1  ORF type:complete len:112 (-),score=16.81 TRINITY_DN3488_c1_g1_i1:454-789(-)